MARGGGFGIREGQMVLDTMMGLRQYLDQKQTTANFNTYLDNLRKDKEWHPTGEYDAKAWNQARLAMLNEQLKQQGVKEGAMNLKFQNYRWQQTNLMHAAQAAYAMQSKDPKRAAKLWEKAYEMVHTGDDLETIVDDEGAKFIIRDPSTGQVTYESDAFETPEEMFDVFQRSTQAMMNPALFDKTMMAIDRKNAQKFVNRDMETIVDKDGKIGYRSTEFNHYSGIWEPIVQVDGKEISQEEYQKRGFKTVSDAKTLADTGLQKEKTETERAKQEYYRGEGKGSGGGTSMAGLHSDEKLAIAFMKAFKDKKMTFNEAMRMVQMNKANANKVKLISDYLSKNDLDLTYEADQQQLARYLKQIRDIVMPVSLEQLRSGGSGQTGQGIPGATKFRQGKKVLDDATAMEFLKQAGGDKDEARRLAREAGYSIPERRSN